MAPSSSPGRRKKFVHPHPAHKCAYGPCCNYVVPPAKGRKHRCCSEECDWHQHFNKQQYRPCRGCERPILRKALPRYCAFCADARGPEPVKAPLPEKVCAWNHCQAVFVPRTKTQKYCRSLCTSSAQVRPGESPSGYAAQAGPTKPTDQLCGNGCGTWGSPPSWATTPFCCYPCWLGRKHGRVNPYTGQPYPAFVASESRKAAAKPWGRECVFCLGRFRVGRMSTNSRHQRACWPCWYHQVGLAIAPLRAQAEHRIVELLQKQQFAQERDALLLERLAIDAAEWLRRVAAEGRHPAQPATITYHGARQYQQQLREVNRLRDNMAAKYRLEWLEWQGLIDHEAQALEGEGLRWRAELAVIALSRQRREEMAPPPPYPVGLPTPTAEDDNWEWD